MKKIISLLMTIILTSALFVGCNSSDKTVSEEGAPEAIDINIGGLKGPTSMGMVKLMEEAEESKGTNNYSFTIAGSADELTPKLIKGELDIAAVPVNLASILYNNTEGEVQLLAVNTLGVLYLVERGEAVQTVQDLKGKTIIASGKSSTPEYTLNYILKENGLDPEKDVTIEWKNEHTEVVSALAQKEEAVALLPQPFVTVAQGSIKDLRVAVDLTEEWEALDNGSQLITGVLVVRRDFAEKNPEQLKSFLKEYSESTSYVNENVEEAADLVEKFDIIKAAVAVKAIPYCNITYMAGTEMKGAVEGFLEVLYNENPKAVGGKLPGEDFYYGN
ncbi:ABC transporter substrate-binding protein [Alloiococcus sp. CFN-8]|uniref:ABC transporter substrate-binding protein n=1 Tax=Alloiococcus sp. CFN-8 TaxID=3416081 RepID=UPI003CEC5CEF